MKNLFICFVFTLLISTFSWGQEQAIKANPIGIAFGIANAGYEFEVSVAQSLTISALYYSISNITGFGVGGEYRFYFSSGEALRGWHAGATAGYFGLSDDFDNSAGVFLIGGEVGHQWIFGEHFLVDVFAGLSVVTGDSDSFNTSFDSLAVGLGVSLGYAW